MKKYCNPGPDLVGVQASLSLQWAHRLILILSCISYILSVDQAFCESLIIVDQGFCESLYLFHIVFQWISQALG